MSKRDTSMTGHFSFDGVSFMASFLGSVVASLVMLLTSGFMSFAAGVASLVLMATAAGLTSIFSAVVFSSAIFSTFAVTTSASALLFFSVSPHLHLPIFF